jgi:phosphoglycerate dehydrogenase-like enzyme/SAM-dependent methyltransferase
VTSANARFLVLVPPQGGLQIVNGTRRFVHGGDRYRAIADSVLSTYGDVDHLAWDPDASLDELTRSLDARLPGSRAVVMAPWLHAHPLPTFDTARFDHAPELRVVAGTFDYRLDWIDLDEATRRDVSVVDTSRTMTWTVAEFAVGITLALLRDIPASIDLVRSGGWLDGPIHSDTHVDRDLAGCIIGLAGYGSINRHYRRLVEPFGCPVAVFDPFIDDDHAVAENVTRATSLVDLASRSDVLVVAIPPTPATLGVVDAEVIDALAPGSLFVLVSRMAVVDQETLWRRVRDGELQAAVDVFDPEPPPTDAWFRTAANVLPTPHIAGNTMFAHERCFREACLDAVRVVRGDAPEHSATVRDKLMYSGRLATESRNEPVDPKKVVAEGYDGLGPAFSEWVAESASEVRSWFLGQVLSRLREGANVLELGCGPGTAAAELSAGRRYVGVDLSEVQLSIARRRVPRATFVCGDLTAMEFRPDSFDGVVAFYVFMHVPEEELARTFERIFSWLRPGGWLMLSLSTIAAGDRVEEWLDVPMYFARFTPGLSERLMKEKGFDIEMSENRWEVEARYGPVDFHWVIARKPED